MEFVSKITTGYYLSEIITNNKFYYHSLAYEQSFSFLKFPGSYEVIKYRIYLTVSVYNYLPHKMSSVVYEQLNANSHHPISL